MGYFKESLSNQNKKMHFSNDISSWATSREKSAAEKELKQMHLDTQREEARNTRLPLEQQQAQQTNAATNAATNATNVWDTAADDVSITN